jgi:hypothetical protein
MKIDSISSSVYGSAYGTQAVAGNTDTGTSGSSAVKSSKTSAAATTSLPDYYYDVRDLNKDGVVTLEEESIYALSHGEQLPGQASIQAGAVQNNAANYNKQGNIAAEANKTPGQINIIV